MCKAYGGDPSVDLLRAFLNLGPAGNWLTLLNRGGFGIPKALTKPITHIERWKGNFFFIENKIVPSKYSKLLLSFMVKWIDGDSEDAPSKKDEVTLIDRTTAEKTQNLRMSASSRAARKRKQTADDPDIHEFPSAKELKDSAGCHFVVAHVTPPSWKWHLKEISLEKLYDIHDKAYMRQVVLDNMLNSRTRKLISTLSKARASCDAIREREVERDKAYAKLERKCNEAQQDLDNSPLVLDTLSKIETLQGFLALRWHLEEIHVPWAHLEKKRTRL
ncbi:hypothetical protein Tco_1153502 [Tanacetum coccineum]